MTHNRFKIKATFTEHEGFVQERTQDASKVIFKVPVCITGSLSVSGSVTFEGDTTFEGNTSFTGSLNVTGSASITGSLDVTGSLSVEGVPVMLEPGVRTVTASQDMLASDGVILLSASIAPVHFTLVPAAEYNRPFYIKRIDGTAHQIVISASSGETIDGGPTAILSVQWTALTLINNNTGWFIF